MQNALRNMGVDMINRVGFSDNFSSLKVEKEITLLQFSRGQIEKWETVECYGYKIIFGRYIELGNSTRTI